MKRLNNPIWTNVSRALSIAGSAVAVLLPTESPAATAPVVAPLGAYSRALQAPGRLAVDTAGNVYVSEPQAGQVVIFDAFGRLAAVKSGFAEPLGLAVDSGGRIFVAEEKTGSVSVFDSQWNLLTKLGAGDGEFVRPNYIALDPASGGASVFVTDSAANTVKNYRNGILAFSFGSPGTNTSQFDFPTGIFMSGAGELFVVDQNNDRVQVFDASGNFLRTFTLVTKVTSGMFGSYAGGRSQGIVGDGWGRIYVADSFQGFVRVFDSLGGYLGKIGVFGETTGQLRLPAGIALDAFNCLYVASLNNSRVEIFGLDSYLHFTSTPANGLLAEGAVLILSVSAGGAGPSTWQWRKDGVNLSDGGSVSGATSATLTLSGAALTDSGRYSVVVNGVTTSPDATLGVLRPPSITQAAASQVVTNGADVVFSVVADGSPALTYQWQKEGQNLDGETTATLSLSQVQSTSAGSYSVIVSNDVGSATAVASLTVLLPPTIVQAPLSLTLATGSDATFSAAATGTLPLTYQWQKNGLDLAGQTNPTLTLLQVQESDSGTYSLMVANAAGSATADAQLLVLRPPVILQAPTNLSVTIGSNATFYVLADGSPRLRYSWQKDGLGLLGQMTATLMLYQVQDSDGGAYTVTVFNDVGSASATASLTITHPPVVQNVSATTTINTPLVLLTSQLLVNASSPDQSPLTVSAVISPSTAGGTALLALDAVTYTPPRGYLGNDSFLFTVTDANGNSASANVLITVTVPPPRLRSVSLTTQGAQLSFEGVPGQTYSLQRMDGWNAGAWTNVGQATVGTDGVGTFLDPTNLTAGASYRALYP